MSKPQSLLFACAFVLMIASILGFDAARGVPLAAVREHPPELASLLDGTWGSSIEGFFDENSQLMRATRSYRNGWLLETFRETPPTVVPGRAGWLYLFSSMGPVKHRERSQGIRMIEDMMSSLVGPKTRVLVLVMPSKWRLYPEHLPEYSMDPERVALYANTLHEIESRGIPTFDVLAFLERSKRQHPDVLLFPPNDTHFTEEGFALLSVRIAQALCNVDPRLAEERIAALPRIPRRFAGDICTMLGLDPESGVGRAHSFLGLDIEAPPCFDEDSAQVLALGDSFFSAYDGVLPRLVQSATGLTVDRRAAGTDRSEMGEAYRRYGHRPPPFLLFALTERRFE